MTILTCPYSHFAYTAPCRVTTCPMHMDPAEHANNCMHQQVHEDLSPQHLAAVMNETPDRNFREWVGRQSKKILAIASDYRAAIDADYSDSCPRCGYGTACQSRELCASRQAVFREADGYLQGTLLPTEFWHLVIRTDVNFLPLSVRQKVQQLVAARDVRHKEGATPR